MRIRITGAYPDPHKRVAYLPEGCDTHDCQRTVGFGLVEPPDEPTEIYWVILDPRCADCLIEAADKRRSGAQFTWGVTPDEIPLPVGWERNDEREDEK